MTSPHGHAHGSANDPVLAADWVQTLLIRTPGAAEATITDPRLPTPVEIVSMNGEIRAKGDDSDEH